MAGSSQRNTYGGTWKYSASLNSVRMCEGRPCISAESVFLSMPVLSATIACETLRCSIRRLNTRAIVVSSSGGGATRRTRRERPEAERDVIDSASFAKDPPRIKKFVLTGAECSTAAKKKRTELLSKTVTIVHTHMCICN